MALLNIESGLELRIINGKGMLYLNDKVIPGQTKCTIHFDRASRGTIDLELSMIGVKVVHIDPPIKPAHSHPLPEGFTAHDGKGAPEGIDPDTVVRVQWGTGYIETEEDCNDTPFTVRKWHDNPSSWVWSEVNHNAIIAYKVEGK